MSKISYQASHNGPLTQEAVAFLRDVRAKKGWSYAALGERLGISPAFTHNIVNKGMNISTETYMTKVAAGIDAMKNGEMAGVSVKNPTSASLLLEHSYHLRDDLKIIFKLPTDLTPREAERVAQFISSLAR